MSEIRRWVTVGQTPVEGSSNLCLLHPGAEHVTGNANGWEDVELHLDAAAGLLNRGTEIEF
jgi:hypothetical protein